MILKLQLRKSKSENHYSPTRRGDLFLIIRKLDIQNIQGKGPLYRSLR